MCYRSGGEGAPGENSSTIRDTVIEVTIPGSDTYALTHVVLDLNGTIAEDGGIIAGVKERLTVLSQKLDIVVVTADTNNNADKLVKDLPATIHKIKEVDEGNQKLGLVLQQGKDTTVAIGNGANDISMLKEAVIGICIIGGEGASAQSIMASDLVVATIHDALDLLIKPHRLIASMRR
jgi:P-type E1-E2 ATPase